MLAILTDPGIGGTFLTWTINYLSGKTQYFSVRKNATVDVPDTPLNDKNAHGFITNQPGNIAEVNQFLPLVLAHNDTMYMHQLRTGSQEAISTICKNASSLIVLALTKDQVLYQCKYESRTHTNTAWTTQKRLTTPEETYNDFVDYFFPESKQKWEAANLNNVWDQREFMALNFKYHDHDSILNYVDPLVDYHHINAMDLWTNFDQSVTDLFDYLAIDIDQSRLDHWTTIYHQWKKLHTNRVRFVWYFEIIVDNIIKGVNFDLRRFQLDISQEAAIQQALICRHNLNLKTWELIKFENTRQLHMLLESNIHEPTPRLTT